MKRTARFLLMSTAAAAVLAGPAWAQTAAPATAPASEETGDPVADAKVAVSNQLSQAAPEDRDGRDIVVTGTRIVRLNNRSAAPITTATAAEIQAQGAINVEDALNRLPQISPLSDQNNQDSEGRQRIALRNLGFERTLTLVDGLRLGLNNGQDVGIIPTQLVERIDVLSGGASSVYGSDAISGVVNFILKKDYDGVSIASNYSFYNHLNKATDVTQAAQRSAFGTPSGWVNDGARADVTLAAGKNLLDDRLNVSGFVNYRHADLVPYESRSISACQVTQAAKDGPLGCGTSTYSTSGFIQPGSGDNSGRNFVNNPDGTAGFIPYGIGAGNAANPYSDYSLQRSFNRLNAGGFLTFKIAPVAELYASALWYRDKSSRGNPARVLSYTAFGSDPYLVNCNNPFLSASQATTICGAQAGTATTAPIDVRYRFAGLPDVRDEYLNTGIRATAGIRGEVGKAWHYDVAGMYSKNHGTTSEGQFPEFARVNNALNVVNVAGTPTCVAKVNGSDPACVPFNAFRAGNNDQALYDYLLSGPQGSQSGVPRLWQVVATASGDLGAYGITSPLAQQGVALALTTEFRDEKFVSTADETYRRLNGGTDSTRRQHVWESNIEVQVPLVEHKPWTDLLQFNGGYRVSKYNLIDGYFSTWKAEGLWAPIPDVMFRGSINKAQRAPTVIELSQALDTSYGVQGYGNDICASTPDANNPGKFLAPQASIEACRATGLPDNLYGSTALSCNTGFCTVRNGGFSIQPETAYTKTFGVVLRPRFLPGLTLSVDRYLIDLNDSIGFNYDDFYSNGCAATASDFYCKGLIRDPVTFRLDNPGGTNPTAGFIVSGTTNFYKSTSHGWDVQGQYTQSLGAAGRVDVLFNGSLATVTGGQDAPDLDPRNCAGYYGPFCGVSFPKWQHGLRTTYTTFDRVLNVSFNWRYIGPMTITYNETNPDGGIPYGAADRRSTYNRIDPYSYFDLAASVTVAKRMTLRLSINNLLDKTPPTIPNSTNIGSRNNTIAGRYDIMGRQLVFGTSLNF